MGWQDATPLDAPAAPTEPKKSGWRGAIPLDQPVQKAGWQSAIPLEAAAPQPWERGEKAQVIQGPPAASQPQGYFEKSWEHLKEIPRDIGQMAKESVTGAPERFRSGWQDAPTIMKPFVGASRAILDAPLVQGANEAMMGDLGMGMSATERAVGGERAGAALEKAGAKAARAGEKAAVSMVQTGKDVHDTPGLDQFELRGTDNKPIGYMTSEYDPEKKNLHVWWVGKTRDEPKVYPASDANTVGPKLFRQALPQLRELYPDLKTISGTRTGGARAAAAPDVSVPLGPSKGTPPRPPAAAEPPGGGPPSAEGPPPTGPSKAGVQDISDILYRTRQAKTASRIELSQKAEAVPKELRNPEVQGRMYAHGELDPEAKLAPHEEQAFQQHIEPLRQESAKLANELKDYGYEVDAEGHMHRMAKGKTREYDPLAGGGEALPYLTGGRNLSTGAPPLKERKYFAIESPTGERRVIAAGNKGEPPAVYEGGKSKPLTGAKLSGESDEFKPGAKFTHGGKEWEIKQARSEEHTSELQS